MKLTDSGMKNPPSLFPVVGLSGAVLFVRRRCVGIIPGGGDSIDLSGICPSSNEHSASLVCRLVGISDARRCVFFINKKFNFVDPLDLAMASAFFNSSSLVIGRRNASFRENKHRITSSEANI